MRRMTVRVTGGPGGDEVSLKVNGAAVTAAVGPGENRDLVLAPAWGFPYYGTVLYDLRFRSGASGPPDVDGRVRGAFVQIALEAERP
jgi:hypothetical protein